MFITDEEQWAHALFGHTQLGDPRRSRRLVSYAADQARHSAKSTAAACLSSARRQGAYRLLHNTHFDTEAIAESAFEHTLTLAAEARVLLAIEDTTTIAYSHAIRTSLGHVSGHVGKHTARGFLAHSVLLADAERGLTYGLAEQFWWMRPIETRSKKHRRRKRAYLDKESLKWERSSERLRERLRRHEMLERVIWVCDREADVYEYLQEKCRRGEPFIVRASQNRLLESGEKLLDHVSGGEVVGLHVVDVEGRGTAVLEVRRARVVLKPTSRRGMPPGAPLGAVELNVVHVREMDPPEQPLEWFLLTTLEVETLADALRVVSYYRRRWHIEEWHKAWKSGCNVEERRLQSAAALKRLAVVLAFVSVRMIQLHQLAQANPEAASTAVLTQEEVECLWASTERAPYPEEAPTVAWAYGALAKLGGFYDSRGTGRPGWQALEKGWLELQARLAGWRLAIKHKRLVI